MGFLSGAAGKREERREEYVSANAKISDQPCFSYEADCHSSGNLTFQLSQLQGEPKAFMHVLGLKEADGMGLGPGFPQTWSRCCLSLLLDVLGHEEKRRGKDGFEVKALKSCDGQVKEIKLRKMSPVISRMGKYEPRKVDPSHKSLAFFSLRLSRRYSY